MPQSAAILFVCLGNICRSPLAEAAFRQRMVQLGQDWVVDSAGIGGWHAGQPPDKRAQAVARQHGVDIAEYRARQVRADDFTRFTHIFALDRENLIALRRLAPHDATASLALLLDVVPFCAGQSVADPYYGDEAGFLATWQQVDRAAEALMARLTG